jgi:hypothetical protein
VRLLLPFFPFLPSRTDPSPRIAFPPPARTSFEDHGKPLRAVETSDENEREQLNQRDGTLPGEEHLDRHAFDHPATYKDYPTIWIPQDPEGLYRDEVEGTQAAGVDVSSDGAEMNVKGQVDISRAPPGEDWDDHHEQA